MAIFQKIEFSLKEESHFNEKEFDSKFGEFKTYKTRKLSDKEIYQLLPMIIFYSGFKASTVENKKEVIAYKATKSCNAFLYSSEKKI